MNSHLFLKGMGLGMLAGAAVGFSLVKNEKTIKRRAKKAARDLGDLVEDTADAVIDRIPR